MTESVRKRILLVEDEAILAMTEKMQLEKYGYAVRTVTTGEQAVDAAQECSDIDLILMDIDLGAGIDGTEAAEIILKDRDIPIVFLSSHTEPEIVGKTEKISSYGYVVKNSSITVLDASMKMAFRLYEAHMELKRRKEDLNTALRKYEQTAEELVEKNEELERYFTSSLDLLCIANTSGELIRLNPEWEKVLGYSVAELEGRSFMEFVHPDDEQKTLYTVSKLENQEEVLNFENRFRCKDGSYRFIEWRSKPIDSKIYAAARDITERQELEASLRNSNERLAAFLHISKEVGVATEMNSLLQQIVDSVTAVTKLRSNAIYLLCGQSKIRLSAAAPPIPEDFPEHLRIADLRDHPHIRAAIETRKTVMIEDTAAVSLTAAEQEVVQARNLKSILYLPVYHQETVLGVIILSSIGTLHSFQEEEITLLQGFADQVGRLIVQVRENESLAAHHAE